MENSKVVLFGQTLIDLTGDTVTADTLAKGRTAHGADGKPIKGTMELMLDVTDDGAGNVAITTNGDITIGA